MNKIKFISKKKTFY